MTVTTASPGRREAMTLERFAALVDAYGAEPSRWPIVEHDLAAALVANDPQARALLLDAGDLDSALGAAAALSEVPISLRMRILADFDRLAQRPTVKRFFRMLSNVVWPGAPMWQPSTALAVSLVAGIVLGVLSPLGRSAQPAGADITLALAAPPPSYLDGSP